jgi:hypothetical protein
VFYAQNDSLNTKIFIRVYDSQGKKIDKGKIIDITETLLEINGKRGYTSFPVESIGIIKTKRAVGNNMIVGTTIGAFTGIVIGYASGSKDPGWFEYSKSDGALAGAIAGAGIGATIGAITIITKRTQTFNIYGDKEKLNFFKETMIKKN